MERVWVALGPGRGRERVAADTGPDDAARRSRACTTSCSGRPATRRPAGSASTSRATARGRPRERARPTGSGSRPARGASARSGRCAIADAASRTGPRRDCWRPRRTRSARRSRRTGWPPRRQAAEIARQSDALKSALLQSVSHDLRTPLATIRAAAGTLRPEQRAEPRSDQRESAEAIDREVEYLNRLVTNLLDLSRIEAGALRAERDVFELDDLVGRTIDRLRPRLAERPLEVDARRRRRSTSTRCSSTRR